MASTLGQQAYSDGIELFLGVKNPNKKNYWNTKRFLSRHERAYKAIWYSKPYYYREFIIGACYEANLGISAFVLSEEAKAVLRKDFKTLDRLATQYNDSKPKPKHRQFDFDELYNFSKDDNLVR